MQKKYRIISAFLMTARVLIGASGPVASSFANLKALDLPISYCEGKSNLEVAPTYFTEIENNVSGTAEYNSLIRLYQKKDWLGLAEGIELFRKTFESSPLIEAIAFLELQAELDQLNYTDSNPVKKFEAKFREILILYPSSSLAPVVTASLANFYLKNGSNSKALGLYQAGREEHPFHDAACVFLYGAAESHFLLHEYENAKIGFKQVAQKCSSTRLQLGARVRQIDIEREQGGDLKKIENQYSKLNEENPHLISRFHPEILFNLGEIKYRSGNIASSSFYFNDFLRGNNDKYQECLPGLYKRLADLSLQTQKKLSEVVGNYLIVREKFPKTDLGRYSRVHAFLLEFPNLEKLETQRRIQIIDEEVASISDPKIQTAASIEKGLALLEQGNSEALNYLSGLNERNGFDIKSGEVGKFIRSKALALFKKSAKSNNDLKDRDWDEEVLVPIESAFATWFKGTSEEETTKVLYSEMIVQRLSESLNQKGLKALIAKLERWKESPLYSKGSIKSNTRIELGTALSQWWISPKNKNSKTSSNLFLANEEILSDFLRPEFQSLWLQAYMDTDNVVDLELALKKMNSKRKLASSDPKMGKSALSYVSLMTGRAYRETKNFVASEEALKKISEPKLSRIKLKELMMTYSESGRFEKVVPLGLKALEKDGSPENKDCLVMMRNAVVEGKQWSSADSVLKAATKNQIKEKELAPFLSMAGRADLERGNCSVSIKHYEEALKLNPEAKDKAESRFYLGKCFFRMKDNKSALKEWQEVASLKDEFWSPLAESEIKLVESP